MAFTVETFRTQFPEFGTSNLKIYSDAQITFWAGIGAKLLNVVRWGDLYDYGLSLFVAHNVSLAVIETDAAELGNAAGQNAGLISSVSADVSYSLDNNAIIEDGGGNYNLTRYGREYLRLARIVGIGGLQID